MYQGTLPPRSNKAGWAYIVEVVDDDTGEAIDLTAATVVFELRNPLTGSSALQATINNGRAAIIDMGFFQVTFTALDMKTLCAETYELGCTISNADSEPQQLILGYVPVLDGVVS